MSEPAKELSKAFMDQSEADAHRMSELRALNSEMLISMLMNREGIISTQEKLITVWQEKSAIQDQQIKSLKRLVELDEALIKSMEQEQAKKRKRWWQ